MEATPSSLNHSEALQNYSRHCERAKHARQSIFQRALVAAWIAASRFALLAMTDTELVIARRVRAVAIQGCRRAQKDRLSRRPDSLFARTRMVLNNLTAGIGWREPGAYGMTAA